MHLDRHVTPTDDGGWQRTPDAPRTRRVALHPHGVSVRPVVRSWEMERARLQHGTRRPYQEPVTLLHPSARLHAPRGTVHAVMPRGGRRPPGGTREACDTILFALGALYK
jgi:hypothetical protein